jgi:hypothetical protein
MEIRDGEWTLFDHDLETGRTIWWSLDENGASLFRVDMPVDSVIEANAEAYKDAEGARFGEWARVASVPLTLLHSSGLHEAHLQEDQKFISKWMNDGDNRAFRTRPGDV